MRRLLKLPLVRAVWRRLRQQKIYREHRELVSFWQPLIQDYCQGKLKTYSFEVKKELPINKVIWQYWGQGVQDQEKLPEVVRTCFASVDR